MHPDVHFKKKKVKKIEAAVADFTAFNGVLPLPEEQGKN